MAKKEIGIGIGVGLVVTILMGIGVWLGMPDKAKEEPVTQSSKAGTFRANGSKSSLKVKTNASGAMNLGQLGGGGQNLTGGTSGTGSSGGSPIDPATFKDYEKYKDGNTALFAEILVGDGAELTAGKKAAVLYKGWLTDGSLFDQSRPGADSKLQPFVFQLGGGQVIPGWEQAVTGMKVGGVRLLIVPPAVGYGAQGQGNIPPNSVLVFQVQLLAAE